MSRAPCASGSFLVGCEIVSGAEAGRPETLTGCKAWGFLGHSRLGKASASSLFCRVAARPVFGGEGRLQVQIAPPGRRYVFGGARFGAR